MSLGLDCGTSRFRALERKHHELCGRHLPTAYAAVPDRDAQRRLLSQARIPCCWSDDALLILGPEAPHVAEALHRPLIPLLPEARLPEEDPIGRQVAARLVEMVLPPPPRNGLATLAAPRDAGPGDPTCEFFTRLLRLHGYETHVIPAVLAVALAELEADQYTGIAASFGAGTASIGLAHRGELVAHAVIEQAGDWIDRRLCERFRRTLFDPAGRQFLDLAGAARWKMSAERSLAAAVAPDEQLLRELYRESIRALLEAFRAVLSREVRRGMDRRPLPLVLHGGGTAILGFTHLWEECWRTAAIDLPVRRPQPTREGNWTVARGCLIHAELMESSVQQRRSA